MYAKIKNNAVIQYPANPMMDNPSISFPNGWNGGIINNSRYVTVNVIPQPVANLGWIVTESTPISNNGIWEQSWSSSLLPTDKLKTSISNKRFQVEVGGVSIANNLYATDRESQTKYVAVAVDISQSNVETFSINWKTLDNQFITLNANQMTQVISGVRQHVQNCFNKEAEYYQLIDTANTTVLESTDFSAGWPSNS